MAATAFFTIAMASSLVAAAVAAPPNATVAATAAAIDIDTLTFIHHLQMSLLERHKTA
jgi:hypothetical protein